MQTGLVSEARNARPLVVDDQVLRQDRERIGDKRRSMNVSITAVHPGSDNSIEDGRPRLQSPIKFSGPTSGCNWDRVHSLEVEAEIPRPQLAILPVRPVGVYATGAPYTGRALAEWGLVVGECNSFVDRRREEGVLGLKEVEVPTLSVDGLGLRQRG